MNKSPNKSEENTIDILKRLTRRIEEAVVDIRDIKRDLKLVRFKVDNVETNTEIMKIDIESIRSETKESLNKLKDDFITRFDKVIGKLEALNDENSIGAYQTGELRTEVDDHEKRISKLEKVAA